MQERHSAGRTCRPEIQGCQGLGGGVPDPARGVFLTPLRREPLCIQASYGEA